MILLRRFLIFSLLLGPIHTAFADTANLIVTVVGVSPNQGAVNVRVFDSPQTYLDKALLELQERPGDSDSVDLLIEDLAHGDYALSVHYDADDDGIMDTRIFGIPKEPVGFSNDARGRFGPAKWEDSRFTLDQDMQIRVNLVTP